MHVLVGKSCWPGRNYTLLAYTKQLPCVPCLYTRSWVQVQRLYERDPVQLMRRLLTGGAPEPAATVAWQLGISGTTVAQEAHAAHCRALMKMPRLAGGSVARVLRYLGELDPQDSSAVARVLAGSAGDRRQRQVGCSAPRASCTWCLPCARARGRPVVCSHQETALFAVE